MIINPTAKNISLLCWPKNTKQKMFFVLFLEGFPFPLKPPSIPFPSAPTNYPNSFLGPLPASSFLDISGAARSNPKQRAAVPCIPSEPCRWQVGQAEHRYPKQNTGISGSYHGVQVLVIVHVNGTPIQQHLPVLQGVEVLQDVDTGALPTP